MARVALTDDNGALYGAPATWADNRFALKGEVPQNTLTGVVSDTEPASPTAGMIWFDTAPPGTDTLDRLAGLVARWRADDLALADGEAVSTVAPRSGTESANLTAAAGQEPVLSASFAGTHKALTFSGASQFMSLNLPSYNAPVTVFGVVDIDTAGTTAFGGRSLDTHMGLLTNSGGTTIRINMGSNPAGGVSTTWAAADGPKVFAGVYSPTTGEAKFYYHALTAITGTTTGPGTMVPMGSLYVGRGPASNPTGASVKVGELAFVSGAVDDVKVKTVMQSLADHYGLTLGA